MSLFVHRHNSRKKRQEREVLQQNIEPFTAPLVASELLPPVLSKIPEPLKHGHSAFEFAISEDGSGQARQHVRAAAPSLEPTSTAAPIPVPAAAPELLPPPAVAPVPAVPIPAPQDQRMPRTTAWRRRKAEEAAAAARAQGLTPKKWRTLEHLFCQKCG